MRSERTVTVASSVGLHARPAALFVGAAALDSLVELLSTDLDKE